MTAVQIADGVRRRRFSAVAVIESHIARTQRFDGLVNALPVRFFREAMLQAEALDGRIAAGESVGILAGVPVSVKECFDVAGSAATVGLTTEFPAAKEDAWVVRAIRDADGIVLGKSNVPQLMVLYETDNPRFGRTANPWNLQRVVGGSSGGEAGALSAGFTALGMGTDLGGSIRIPASFCGVCGFKPTSQRLPRSGAFRNFRGMEAFGFQPGPMARSVGDLRLAMHVLESFPFHGDPNVPPVSTNWDVEKKRCEIDLTGVRVASVEPDDAFPRHTAVDLAMQRAETALKASGVVLERVEFPYFSQAFDLYVRILAADGGRDVRRLAKGSRLHPLIRQMFMVARIPAWTRPIVGRVLHTLGARDEAIFVRAAAPTSAAGYWKLVARLENLIQEFHYWMTNNRWSAVLTPVFRTPAFCHGQGLDLIAAATDAFFPSLIGAPAGVVPIRRVLAGDERAIQNQHPRRRRVLERVQHGAEGLPIGIQLFAPRWQDPLVLDLLQAIEDDVQRDSGYPATPVKFAD